jgi:hypothetical protein
MVKMQKDRTGYEHDSKGTFTSVSALFLELNDSEMIKQASLLILL